MTTLLDNIKSDIAFRKKILCDDGLPTSTAKVLFADGISAVIIYRLMQACNKNRWLKPLAFVCHKLNKLLNHCIIGMGADFGPGLALMHPVGIVINSMITGGEQIALESGVVLGSVRGKCPTLGNNIYIGAGAKIIGGLTLEDDTKVGANAVVTKSAFKGQTLVGIPAKPL